MSETVAEPGRRRRSWAAFLLNLLLPPTGYIYVGRWRWAAAFLVTLAVLAVGALLWSYLSPPGIYAWLRGGQGPYSLFGLCLTLPTAVHAGWLARGAAPTTAPRIRRLPVYLAAAVAPLAVSLVIRAFLPISIYDAMSASMNPTLSRGETLGVSGARALCGSPPTQAGDVVIYRRGKTRFVHRVVAGPGQVVLLRDGVLSIDGKPVRRADTGRIASGVDAESPFPMPGRIFRETLSNGRSYETLDLGPEGELDDFGPVNVPHDTWFILGDNRDNVIDSRSHGAVAQNDICGIATRILMSARTDRVGARP